MPVVLFLISVIVSSSFYLAVERVAQNSVVNQALLTSTAAFYTASSSAEVSWSDVLPADSTGMVTAFDVKTRSGEDLFKKILKDRPDGSSSLELNQGVESTVAKRSKSLEPDSFAEVFFQSSAELLLAKVTVSEAIGDVLVEYCFPGETCPELIIEWFRLGESFQFYDLESLKTASSDQTTLSTCLDDPSIHIRRCILRSGTGSRDAVEIRSTSSDPRFVRSFQLRTDFPQYQYLLRFRALNRESFHFRVVGLRGGKVVGLPSAYFEVDELGQTRDTFRRVREQRMVTGGLQDGLEFVHSAEVMGEK